MLMPSSRRLLDLATLAEEVEKLRELIPVPTPEEFEEMVRGERPLTLEVLLLGVLGESLFHLNEAAATIDYYRPFTEEALETGTHARWRENLADRIRREVEEREDKGEEA